jgi:hypothetical protein
MLKEGYHLSRTPSQETGSVFCTLWSEYIIFPGKKELKFLEDWVKIPRKAGGFPLTSGRELDKIIRSISLTRVDEDQYSF